MARHRLITLSFSHYNEKARWALDWCGISYDESRYMPGFSQLAVWVATRGRGGRSDKVSTKLSAPVLVTASGEALCDSTDIARWASAQVGDALFPVPEVLELVDQFGTEIGPYTRRIAYYHAMRARRVMRDLAARNVGHTQALAFRAVAPLFMPVLVRALSVDAAHVARAIDKVHAQLAFVEARLARGPYLVGDRFTAADLSFAALLAPVLLIGQPEGYGATLPGVDELQLDAQALVTELRTHPAAAFALDVYRRHRHARHDGAATSPVAGSFSGVADTTGPR